MGVKADPLGRERRSTPRPLRGRTAEPELTLITACAIDDMLERQAGLETLDLTQHVGGKCAQVGGRGVVRRDRDLGMAPQRAYSRQRFAREDVKRCPCERAFVERGENIGLDLKRAARGIDQVGAAQRAVALEPAQKLYIEEALRCRRHRKQTDENLGAAQERLEPPLAVKAFDAGKRPARSAQTGDR